MVRCFLGKIASRSFSAVGKWHQQQQPQLPCLNIYGYQARAGDASSISRGPSRWLSVPRLGSASTDMAQRVGVPFLVSRRHSSAPAAAKLPSERFPCQHERRGELCKTLEKRNILDHKRRLLAAKYELRRKLYKAVCRDPELPAELRDRHRCKLSRLPRNSSFVRVRNRCISTGRPRAVLRLFRMSRITFREKASQGALMGVKKSSW